jgi:predicted membrane protein
MDQDSSFVVTPRTVFGVAIALLGFALALDRMGIVEANHLLRFWPVPIMLIGGLMAVQARDGRERTRGLIFAGIGTWLFLNTEGLVSVRVWELFWPIILMLIGFSLVFRSGGPRRRHRRFGGNGPFGSSGPLGPDGPLGPNGPLGSGAPFGSQATTGSASGSGSNPPFGASESFVPSSSTTSVGAAAPTSHYVDRSEKLSMFAVWSSVRRASAASPFRGGDITAIMGGGQLDLRLARIPPGEEAILDIVAVMGGVEILVPSTWDVSTPIFPFMGGVEDKRFPPLPTDPNVVGKENSGRLVLRGIVMMGGVHIKS